MSAEKGQMRHGIEFALLAALSMHAFVLLLGVFILRALSLIPFALDDDEAWFAASARSLKHPFDFFQRTLDNKPPGTVWAYWIVQRILPFGSDPRAMRAMQLLLAMLTTWLVAKCAFSLSLPAARKKAAWLAAFVFAIASALPSPQLLSTTTEGLMLPMTVAVVYLLIRSLEFGPEKKEALFLGILFGALLMFKQTGAFFLLPILYVGRASLKKGVVWPSTICFLLGFAFAFGIPFWGLGAESFLYWTIAYPGQVLSVKRSELFSQWAGLPSNSILFGLFLAPLVGACRKRWSVGLTNAKRNLILLWLIASLGPILIGKGLFLHYYQFLVPPLSVVFALAAPAFRRRSSINWLAVPYVCVCALAAVPAVQTFWGVDLAYYSRVGRFIEEETEKDERIFIWGGSALPAAASDREFSTRFVTTRYAVAPYGTKETEKIFRREFEENPPKLFVDLHERGDCRFNMPPESLGWLAEILRKSYVAVRDPSIPWATFYRRADAGRVPAAIELSSDSSSFDYESIYRQIAQAIGPKLDESKLNALSIVWRLPNALALGKLLQVWDGLRVLTELDPFLNDNRAVSQLHAKVSLAARRQVASLAGLHQYPAEEDLRLGQSSLDWLKREFELRRESEPLSTRSKSWWVSLALVKLQPVAFKTDNPVPRKL